MATDIKDHLQNTFEDLGADDFRKFTSKLCDRKKEPRVRRATIEKVADAIDLANLMVNTFTRAKAVDVTIEILEAIGYFGMAEDLKESTGYVTPPLRETPPDVSPPLPKSPSDKMHFIDEHWETLIQRVNNVNAVLDALLQKKVISYEDYSNIIAEKTPQAKMRNLLIGPITSAGIKGKDVLYEALKKTNLYLIEELEKA